MSQVRSVTPEAIASSLEFQIGNQGFRVGGELTEDRYTGEIGLPDGRVLRGLLEAGRWRMES